MADITLGTDAQTGKPVTLKEKDYALGGYLMGVRRVGKSYLLEQLIMQSINNRRGVCVIDPHGDLLENVIGKVPQDRLDDVIYLDPLDYEYPFPMDAYYCSDKHNPVAVRYTNDRVMHLYKKLWESKEAQPLVEDTIRMTTLAMIETGMTMVEVPLFIDDDAFRARLLPQINNRDARQFWENYHKLKRQADREEVTGAIARRVRAFSSDDIIRCIVGQKEKKLNFREIIDDYQHPKIVLVKLYAGELDELTTLIGSMIIMQLLHAAMSRKDTTHRPEFHLYCDEYANFDTRDFSTLIEQAGKYNIIPFIAHQSRGQISEENQDSAMQLGLIVCFRVIPRDDNDMAGCFDCTPVNAPIPMVIPGNVLDHLKTHQSQDVQDLWRYYVREWQELAKKDETIRYQHRHSLYRDNAGNIINENFTYPDFLLSGATPVERRVTVLPRHDFHTGKGMIEYNPQDIKDALFQLEELLRYVMKGGGVQYYNTLPIVDPSDNTNIIIQTKEVAWWGTPHIPEIMHILAPYYGWGEWVEWHYDGYRFASEYPNATTKEIDERFAKIPDIDLLDILNVEKLLSLLAKCARALYKDPILLPAVPILPLQQNFADKKNQIANELSSLPQRTAKVRINRRHEGITEHTIQTIIARHQPNYRREHDQKKEQIVQNMHNTFKTRAEVEEEIRQRQNIDNQPTKRIHKLQ
jgi:hypothetical protein